MTFQLPDLTALAVIVSVVAVLAVVVAGVLAPRFLARNRAVRLSRREPVLRYYGHLVTGH